MFGAVVKEEPGLGLLDKGASLIVPNWGTLLLIEQLCIILITAYADR